MTICQRGGIQTWFSVLCATFDDSMPLDEPLKDIGANEAFVFDSKQGFSKQEFVVNAKLRSY